MSGEDVLDNSQTQRELLQDMLPKILTKEEEKYQNKIQDSMERSTTLRALLEQERTRKPPRVTQIRGILKKLYSLFHEAVEDLRVDFEKETIAATAERWEEELTEIGTSYQEANEWLRREGRIPERTLEDPEVSIAVEEECRQSGKDTAEINQDHEKNSTNPIRPPIQDQRATSKEIETELQQSQAALNDGQYFRTQLEDAMERFEANPSVAKRAQLESWLSAEGRYADKLTTALRWRDCPPELHRTLYDLQNSLSFMRQGGQELLQRQERTGSNSGLGHSQRSTSPSKESRSQGEMTDWMKFLMLRDASTELPVFKDGCGEYRAWKAAAEIVRQCPVSSEIVLFNRLKKSLEGQAARTTQHILPFQQGALEELFKTLEDRFGRPEVVVAAQYERLAKLPSPRIDCPDALQTFITTVRSIAATLETCGQQPTYSFEFLRAVKQRIPIELGRRWVRTQTLSMQTLGGLLEFLQQEVKTLQRSTDFLNLKTIPKKERSEGGEERRKEWSQFGAREREEKGEVYWRREGQCAMCQGQHDLTNCPDFEALEFGKRLFLAFKKFKVCRRCLKRHQRGACPVPMDEQACPIDPECPFRHHPLLHRPVENTPEKLRGHMENCSIATLALATHHLHLIPVIVKGPHGVHSAVAMFDDGSSKSFIQEQFARRLGLRIPLGYESQLFGIHGAKQLKMAPVTFEIKGKDTDNKEWFRLEGASTLPMIELPDLEIDWGSRLRQKREFAGIPLHRLRYREVKIILGADAKQLRVTQENRWDQTREHLAFKTPLGWCISGPRQDPMCQYLVGATAVNEERDETAEREVLEALLREFRRFNEIEDVPQRKIRLSMAEERDLKRMKEGLRYNEEGRPCLPMIWRNFLKIPPSEAQARRRLFLLHQKLERDVRFMELYREGIRQDVEKGYIRKLSSQEAQDLRDGPHYFLPHFAVVKEDPSSRMGKCRRVWDARAKNDGLSLNDLLLTGPNLLESLFGIILRFRTGRFAITADISEMFPQVLLPPEDQRMVAFLWSETKEREPEVYVNLRQVFGAKCSPSNACFAVLEACRREGLGQAAEGHFYMDDWFLSGDVWEQVLSTAKEVERALRKSCFTLAKWMANDLDMILAFPKATRATAAKELSDNGRGPLPASKVLGVHWDCGTDSLGFSFKKQRIRPIHQVADVLSVLAAIFDPLGIVGPFTARGKELFQKIWLKTKDWKAEVPNDDKQEWERWFQGIEEVHGLQVPRHFGIPAGAIRMHVFTDASLRGLGAVVYITAVMGGEATSPGKVTNPVFTAGKHRVINPEKHDAGKIERLELQAAVVGIRLAKAIKDELESVFQVTQLVIWIDNTTVLWWLQDNYQRYGPYVANRLRTIREITEEEFIQCQTSFRYVPTSDNPADLASRGASAKEFTEKFDFWIKGPEFLRKREEEWPNSIVPMRPVEDPEIRQELAEVFVSTPAKDAGKTQEKDLRSWLAQRSGHPRMSLEEREKELRREIREAQETHFKTEYQRCAGKKGEVQMLRQGPLKGLQVFWHQGLLLLLSRVGMGDLVPLEERQPVILPKEAEITKVIAREAHREAGHLGRDATKGEFRRRYFTTGLTTLVKGVVNNCNECQQRNLRKLRVPIAPLHTSRLQVGKEPFTETGMDHFGPVTLRRNKRRWGLIFTCLTSRAIHLEDVRSTGVADTLLALERFIGRRGRPKILRCDQAAAFKSLAEGKSNLVKMVESLEERGTRVILNPAGAPHWGGAWERLIREVKKLLRNSCQSTANLSEEAFRTSLVQMEGILNRRPLAFGEDGQVLAPCQLLGPSVPISPRDLNPVTIASVRQVHQAVGNFWRKFRQWFLMEKALARVDPGHGTGAELQPGDWVLVDDKRGNLFTNQWKRGQITQIHRSPDGIIRSVTLECDGRKGIWIDIRRIAVVGRQEREQGPPQRPRADNGQESRHGGPKTNSARPGAAGGRR